MAKSFKDLRGAEAKALLPTHPSAAAAEVPDEWHQHKNTPEADKSKSLLPTHPSSANAELPDSFEGKVGPRAVAKELDGKAIAQAAGKHGNAESNEEPDHAAVKANHEGGWDQAHGQKLAERLEQFKNDVEAALAEAKKEEKSDKDEDSDEEDEKEVKEHLDAISGDFLSEEVRNKVKVIFETAVNTSVEKKLSREKARLQEAYFNAAKTTIEKIEEQLSTELNDYLDYIVEEWLAANELSVEAGLRSELAEDFMLKLKGLLEDHFVDVPENKRNLLNEKEEKISELEKELNETLNKNVELTKKLNQGEKEETFKTICEGLSDLETERFRKLIQVVEFTNPEQFAETIQIIKESYFGKSAAKSEDISSTVVENGGIKSEESNGAKGEMDFYAEAITRSVRS